MPNRCTLVVDGSAVDKENLTRNLEAYAAAGMGTMEITWFMAYRETTKDIPFLSPRWMQMLQYTESEASRLGNADWYEHRYRWPSAVLKWG